MFDMERLSESSDNDDDDDDNDIECADGPKSSIDEEEECAKEDEDYGIGDLFPESNRNSDTVDGQASSEVRSPYVQPGQRPISSSSLVSGDARCCRGLSATYQKLKQLYKNYYKVLRMAITSMLVCTIDSGSDVATTVSHFFRCNWWWGSYSAILIIIPNTVIGFKLLRKEMWIHRDFRERKKKGILIICLILQILVVYWFIWKFRTWWRLIKEKIHANETLPSRDLKYDMEMFKKVKAKEGLLEGSLQLALQSYILLKKISNAMIEEVCPNNCNNYALFNGTTDTTLSNSYLDDKCIDIVQIVGIALSLLAVSYSQAFMYQRHHVKRKLARFLTYIPLISIRMFIPAVLGVCGSRTTWFLPPVASLICYFILYYIRRSYTKRGYNLPKILKMETQNTKVEAVLKRNLLDVLYWGLNHLLFNVSSVSGLAISFPYMICTLPSVILVESDELYFYRAATGLSVMCVFINIIFVVFFKDPGKKIIPLSSDT